MSGRVSVTVYVECVGNYIYVLLLWLWLLVSYAVLVSDEEG